uniref:Sec-independent protein translocase protein TatB n=1 Tax=Castellaniella defragrans TaxID=75697 RepID=UPI00333FDA3A
MFDVSFSELMLIGVIALIVIGPERLPKVARTIGHLLGRAQRYVNEVKSDIQREIDLKEIGDIKNQMQDAARSVESSMHSSVDELKAAVTQPTESLRQTMNEAREALTPTLTPPPASGDTQANTAPAALPAATETPVTPPQKAAETTPSSEKQA